MGNVFSQNLCRNPCTHEAFHVNHNQRSWVSWIASMHHPGCWHSAVVRCKGLKREVAEDKRSKGQVGSYILSVLHNCLNILSDFTKLLAWALAITWVCLNSEKNYLTTNDYFLKRKDLKEDNMYERLHVWNSWCRMIKHKVVM